MEGFYPEVDLGQGQVDALKPMQDWQNVLLTQQNKYHTMADTQRLMANTKLTLQQAKQAQAQTGLIGAQTGLTGAQTVGQQINNELSGYRAGWLGSVFGQGGAAGSAAPAGAAAGTASSYGGATGRDLVLPAGGAGGSAGAARPDAHPAVPLPWGAPSGPQSSATPMPDQPGAHALASAAPSGGNALAVAQAVRSSVPAAQPIGGEGGAQPPQSGAPGIPPSAFETVSPNGMLIPGMGMPIPRMWSGALLGPDPGKAIGELAGQRRQMLSQILSGATDPGSWNAGVRNAYEQGFITAGRAWQLYNHFDQRDAVERSLATPESQVGYQSTLAGSGFTPGATAPQPNAQMLNAKGPITVTKAVQGSDGRWYQVPVQEPRAGYVQSTTEAGSPAAAASGQPGQPAQPAGPAGASAAAAGQPGAMSWQQYSAALSGRESGDNPAAGQNPRSSASGLYQFENRSWLQAFRQAYPDMANISDEQALAMRSDRSAQDRVLPFYTRDNIAALQAQKIPVNATTMALAHQLGPAGEVAVLNAPADAPLARVLPRDVMQANPQFARMRVGDLIQQTKAQFPLVPVQMPGAMTGREALGLPGESAEAGAQPPQAPNPGQPVASALPGAAPSLESVAAGAPPGTVIGAPTPVPLGPVQKIQTAADQDLVAADGKLIAQATSTARTAQQADPTLLEARSLITDAKPGAFGDWRTKVASFLNSYGGPWSDEFLKRTAGIDPSKAPQMEQLQKLLFQAAGNAAQTVAGHNTGSEMTRMYSNILPNMNKQPETVRGLTNDVMVFNQYLQDYARSAAGYYNQNRQAFVDDPVGHRYQPLSGFDKQWLNPDGASSPRVYAAAAAALNGNKNGDWTQGLSKQQIAAAIAVVRSVDPSAIIQGPNGPLRFPGGS